MKYFLLFLGGLSQRMMEHLPKTYPCGSVLVWSWRRYYDLGVNHINYWSKIKLSNRVPVLAFVSHHRYLICLIKIYNSHSLEMPGCMRVLWGPQQQTGSGGLNPQSRWKPVWCFSLVCLLLMHKFTISPFDILKGHQ
jgi:hypothetical protein